MPNYQTFCFYYNWYENNDFDGTPIYWKHLIISVSGTNENPELITGKNNDIASNFFPLLRLYSNSDPKTIEQHLKMISDARIGVLAVTWWDESDIGAENIPIIMDKASKYDVKICFHIEPFPGRNAITTRQNIEKIIGRYGNHPAFYRMEGKPVFLFTTHILPPLMNGLPCLV